MRLQSIILLVSLFCINELSSQTGPWQAPLKICTGTNGIMFGTSTIFQDSSGVPTVIRIGTSNSDTLLAAFQWFPAPMNNPKWDKIAIKKSYDGGVNWTTPITCTFIGVPVGNQRPFDPGLVQMPNGQIRMYFSNGLNNPPSGGIDTYSGISNDGVTYTFEPTPRFGDATKHAIDPTVAFYNGIYYDDSWSGVQSDGAFRAISTDALTFTTQAVVPFDNSHLWLGNYLNDGSTLKFYGCGNSIWMNSSADGVTWGGFNNTNVGMGADPAVVKTKNGTYLMIYTGPPNSTGIDEQNNKLDGIAIYPNEFETNLTINGLQKGIKCELKILDLEGKQVFYQEKSSSLDKETIDLSHLTIGYYFITVKQEKFETTRKIVKKQ